MYEELRIKYHPSLPSDHEVAMLILFPPPLKPVQYRYKVLRPFLPYITGPRARGDLPSLSLASPAEDAKENRKQISHNCLL